jgi:predicted permease
VLQGLGPRLRALFAPGRVRREIDEELRSHLERERDRLMARGVDRRSAELGARRAFGNITVHAESAARAYGRGWLDHLVQDARYAFRTFRRSPVMTAIAILSLAITIGANTVIFTAIDALLFQPLPVSAPDRLVTLEQLGADGTRAFNYAFGDYEAFRRLDGLFEDVYATTWGDGFNIVVGGEGALADQRQARVSVVTGNFFAVLGLRAAPGRLLTPDDDRDDAPRAVVVSERYWRERLGGALDVPGRTMTMLGTTFTIVGVAPPGFRGDWVGWPTDIWVPVASINAVFPFLEPGLRGGRMQYKLVARLARGVSIEQAQVVGAATHRRLAAEPNAGSAIDRRSRFTLAPAGSGYSTQRDALTRPLSVLMATVGLVLLIACANVANLLLARSLARDRELAVRLALGASRRRIVRQLLTESVLLAAIAGIVGLGLAAWGSTVVESMTRSGPTSSVLWGASSAVLDLGLTRRGALFTAAVCSLTAVLFGIIPALEGSRRPVVHSVLRRDRASRGPAARPDLRAGLIIVQVAVTVALLAGATLLMRSLTTVRGESIGFDRERVLLVWTLPGYAESDRSRILAQVARVERRLASLPGVSSVSASVTGIFSGDPDAGRAPLRAAGGASTAAAPLLAEGQMTVAPGFFDTVGQRLVAGRDFTSGDSASASLVAIIDEALARRLYPGSDVIGKQLLIGSATTAPPYTIVGVVSDAKLGSPRSQPGMTIYYPYTQARNLRRLCFVVRVDGDLATAAALIRDQLRTTEPLLPVLEVDSVNEQLDHTLFRDRLVSRLSLFFSAIALILACGGIVGVVAFVTAQRTREIGVRMALGATRSAVVFNVLRENATTIAAGIVLGLLITMPVRGLIATMLYEAPHADAWAVGGAALLVATVATVATLVPAMGAARVDPAVALRGD